MKKEFYRYNNGGKNIHYLMSFQSKTSDWTWLQNTIRNVSNNYFR